MKGGINETDFWAVANFTGNPYDATIYAQQINVTNQTGFLYTFEYWNYQLNGTFYYPVKGKG